MEESKSSQKLDEQNHYIETPLSNRLSKGDLVQRDVLDESKQAGYSAMIDPLMIYESPIAAIIPFQASESEAMSGNILQFSEDDVAQLHMSAEELAEIEQGAWTDI